MSEKYIHRRYLSTMVELNEIYWVERRIYVQPGKMNSFSTISSFNWEYFLTKQLYTFITWEWVHLHFLSGPVFLDTTQQTRKDIPSEQNHPYKKTTA